MKVRGAQGQSKMPKQSKLDESKVTPRVSQVKTEVAHGHPKRCPTCKHRGAQTDPKMIQK